MINFDVIIVGLGPVGLVLANLLGQQGHRVLGVDKVLESYHFPRAIHLDAEIIRILQVAGLSEQLLPLLRPCPYLELNDKHFRPLIRASIDFDSGYSANDYMFYQPELEDILKKGCDRFPNVTLLWGTEITGISQGGTEVAVESNGQLIARSKFLIASDGAKSGVRNQLGLTQRNFGFEKGALKIDALEEGDEVLDTLHVQKICSHDRPWVRMKGRGKHRRWELNYRMTMSREEYEKPETVRFLLEEIGVDTRKLEIVHAVWYRFRGALSQEWRKGKVFLAGDAAHVTPPYIGQGMCAGFRDALNLSWKLDLVLKNNCRETILDTYQSERLPQVRINILIAIAIGRLFTTRLWYLLKLFSSIPGLHDMLLRIRLPLDPLGKKGLWGTGKASRTLFPQLKTESGQFSDVLLEKGWAIVALGGSFSPEESAEAEKAGLLPVSFAESEVHAGFLKAWSKKNKAKFVIVRPDLYVFSGGYQAFQLIKEYKQVWKAYSAMA